MSLSMATPTEQKQFVSENVSPGLAFIFDDVELQPDVQYKIVKAGYKSVRRIAAIDDGQAGARAALKQLAGIEDADNPEQRLTLTILVDIWNICRVTAEKEIEAKAQATVAGATKPISNNDRTAMKKIVEKSRGPKTTLPDDEVPSQVYLTAKVDEVEQNEPRASPLDEISHTEHRTEADLSIGLDPKGVVKTFRKALKVDMPSDTESYRKRLKVEANLWLMLASKYINKPWLSDLDQRDFENFVEYILGKKVLNVFSDSPYPRQAPWSLVMSFELRLRQEAFKLVRDGKTLAAALESVINDSDLRSLYFITNLVADKASQGGDPGLKRPASQALVPFAPEEPWTRKGKKGKDKGKGKGKDKGKGKQTRAPADLGKRIARTANNESICFNFNRPVGCPLAGDGGTCPRGRHVCLECHGNHSLSLPCPRRQR